MFQNMHFMPHQAYGEPLPTFDVTGAEGAFALKTGPQMRHNHERLPTGQINLLAQAAAAFDMRSVQPEAEHQMQRGASAATFKRPDGLSCEPQAVMGQMGMTPQMLWAGHHPLARESTKPCWREPTA